MCWREGVAAESVECGVWRVLSLLSLENGEYKCVECNVWCVCGVYSVECVECRVGIVWRV